MKNILFTAVILSTAVAMTTNAANKPTSEERERLIQEKLGGLIEVPAKGSIVVVNNQSTIKLSEIDDAIKLDAKNLQTPINIIDGKFSISTASATVAKLGGTAGIFIIDDPLMPMSLISPEELWGMMNIAKLKVGADGEKLAKRARKEFNRVLAKVFGGGLSTQKSSIMRPVTKAEELDKIINMWIPFDTLNVVFNAMPDYGIAHRKVVPYKKACQEGWAPAPTNEFQKAIWDKVHAMPTEPIKIKPETKKQEK